jgi:competence protein ComEA
MLGRRSSPDPDAVAAAQRRLAAIAAQFDSHPGRVDVASAEPGDPSSGGETVGPENRTPVHEIGGVEPARHAARPTTVPARWALTPHQVAVIALVAVVAVVVAAWWVVRSMPHSEPVQLSTQRSLPVSPVSTSPATAAVSSGPVSSAAAGGAAALSGTATSSGQPGGDIVVDVAGKVRRPGIVELPAGSRVVDALAAAGGPRSGVDTRSLNLARPLVDGEQIVVGYAVPAVGGAPPDTASTGPTAAEPVQRVNLNTADAEQLDTLPDIGPVTAQSILAWRQQNGAFTSVDELLEVSGIGDATLADVAPYVYV